MNFYKTLRKKKTKHRSQNGATVSEKVNINKKHQGDISNRAFKIKRPLLVKSYPKFPKLFAIFGGFVSDNLKWYPMHTYSRTSEEMDGTLPKIPFLKRLDGRMVWVIVIIASSRPSH